MIAITHTPATGSTLEGTTRGDRTNQLLKPLGWRWSANIGCWYLRSSRDTPPRLQVITETATTLRAAGHQVIVAIDGGHRDTDTAEADRAARQQDRAAALAHKADRDTAAAVAAHDKARQLAGQIPFGQTILVGHHSESRMRRHAQRIHATMDTAVTAAAQAEETVRRAQVAAAGTDARYHPVTVANRISTLTADRNRITRLLDGHTRTLSVTEDGTRHTDTTQPATGPFRDRLTTRLAEVTDQLTYWEGIHDQQVSTGAAAGHSQATINPGHQVRIRGRWYPVVRANKKTVTVPSTLGSWTDTAPYQEITAHHPADTTGNAGTGCG